MASWGDGIDEETAALVIQIQLQDIRDESERSRAKGKGVEGSLSDSQVGLKLIQQVLERDAAILMDRKMARSMNQAVRTDAQLLATSISQEKEALNDRAMACRLGGVAPPPLETEPAPAETSIDDRILDVMSALFIEEPTDVDKISDSGFESQQGGTEDSQSTRWDRVECSRWREQIQCVICREDGRFYNVTPVSCTHSYCRECLQRLFQRSFTDESLFPPRCCGKPIEPDSVRFFLTAEIMNRYEEKKVELETPNRTYCSVPTCSTFLRRESIEGDCGTCPACAAKTCTICKAEWHDRDCPFDTGLQLVLATAEREGWKRCICGRVVEHNLGCNHMICPCGHNFCYECTKPWKTCPCPIYHVHRLMLSAIDRVAREPARPGIDSEDRLAAARRAILNQHGCGHRYWSWTEGEAQCNRCTTNFRLFIYVCDNCQENRCASCRFNS